MRTMTIFFAMLCVAGLAAVAVAQPPAPEIEGPEPGVAPPPDRPGPPPKPEDERELRELVQVVMIARLAKALELTDEQTVVLTRKFEEHREQTNELSKQRRDAAQGLRESIKNGEPEETMRQKLDALTMLDETIAKQKTVLYEELSKGLNTGQQAKLYLFLGDFQQEIRKMVQRARQRGRQMGGLMGDQPGPGVDRPGMGRGRALGQGPRGPMPPMDDDLAEPPNE